MSAGKDPQRDRDTEGGEDELQNEIDRTMAEAEAAVSALGGEEPADDGGADEEETAVSARVEELEAEVVALRDKWLRAVADHENYKKRVRREIDEALLRHTQALLPSFLSVMDNLERALEIAEPIAREGADAVAIEQLVQGIRMVRDEFMSALAKHGIEPVESVGRPFDPAVHDALQQIDSPDHAPGMVVTEFEKGYRMGERLLRPARVIVAGAGSTGAPPDDGGTTEN